MTTAPVVTGREIVELFSANPRGIRLSQLSETIAKRYGPSVTFQAASAVGLDLDEMLEFLEARGLVRIIKSVVLPGRHMAHFHA